MKTLKNSNFVHFLLLNITLYASQSTSQPAISFCGKMKIRTPFSIHNSNTSSSFLNNILLCRYQKLYFRTSLGLFEVSSIDYTARTLTISHTSCSSSLHFVSPTLLSAAFPSPPQSNSLLLFNCVSQRKSMPPFLHNCSRFYGCKDHAKSSSCWAVHDLDRLEMGFDPKDMNCSHYSRVYRDAASASSNLVEEFKMGTIISYDIPDHIPNICDECAKPQGNCGVGLKCICHPKECRDKVISKGAPMRPYGEIFLYLLISTTMSVVF